MIDKDDIKLEALEMLNKNKWYQKGVPPKNKDTLGEYHEEDVIKVIDWILDEVFEEKEEE